MIRITARSVARAKRYTPNVEFSATDATRSDVEFLLAVIEAAIREGATTINIPETVGYVIALSLETSFVLSAKNQGNRKSNIERPLA